MGTKTVEWWAGEGGDQYLARNQVSQEIRQRFWQHVITRMVPPEGGALRVFELGCNRGHNLAAIRAVSGRVEVCGMDVNTNAVQAGRTAGLPVWLGGISEATQKYGAGAFDLVITAGLLIHIPPDDLEPVMRQLAALSKRYVLGVEYEHDAELEIQYRGQSDLLWKRPYGELYQKLGLGLVDTWPATKDDGFDNCTAWLLEKS